MTQHYGQKTCYLMSSHKLENSEQMKQTQKWQAPTMQAGPDKLVRNRDDHLAAARGDPLIPTADTIEQWRKDAEAEGYAQGMESATQEVSALKHRILHLIDFFEQPLRALNEEVEQQLTLVAVTLAQQLVRREIRVEPGEILGLIRESVQMLPANARNISVILHPDDAALVRSALSIRANDDEQSWKLIEDPMVTRGGCEIKSDASMINATLENRLSALAASVLGGEREQD